MTMIMIMTMAGGMPMTTPIPTIMTMGHRCGGR